MNSPALLPFALAAALVAAAPLRAEGPATLTVTGEGSVEAVPDMASVMLGVTAQAETARAAMDEVSAGVAALLEVLAAAGIEPRDVQTSGLSVNPVWAGRSYGQSGDDRIDGFVASNGVTVRVRALDGLGGVLDGTLSAGANTFNGLSFGLQDPRPSLDEARRRAVADARAKAELYAAAAGVTLGPIASISESSGYTPPMPMYRMEAAASAAPVPVAAGEVSVAAQVTIVWEIAAP